MATEILAEQRTDRQRQIDPPGMKRLVRAVRDLSRARQVEDIVEIVRIAARELMGADGSSFILQDGDQCHYVDEDAIEPTWKGRRFPANICIGGWAMRHRQPVVIENVEQDARIPIEAYRPTYIKSLVVVPVRPEAPIAAIGAYWAKPHQASPGEVELIQALADSTSIAFENVQLYQELEQRVQDRTRQLQMANDELEAFSYSVSHDLRTPVANVTTLAEMLLEEALPPDAAHSLELILESAQHMDRLIRDLLRLASVARAELDRTLLDLSQVALDILAELRRRDPERHVEIRVAEGLRAEADPVLVRTLLANLLENAWKYSGRRTVARIEVGLVDQAGAPAYFVRDNGAGFDMAYHDKLFTPFQRLHSAQDYAGTGIGLATVARIVHRHGGRIWAESAPDQGACFYFTLA